MAARRTVAAEANEVGETPLVAAAERGHLEVVVELLRHRHLDAEGVAAKNRSGYPVWAESAREARRAVWWNRGGGGVVRVELQLRVEAGTSDPWLRRHHRHRSSADLPAFPWGPARASSPPPPTTAFKFQPGVQDGSAPVHGCTD